MYNTTYGLNWTSMASSPDFKEMLSMDLEAPKDVKDGPYGNVFSGYFKPPITGRYRFYMSCDDLCQLYLSNTTMDPTQATKILDVTAWGNHRAYFTVDGSK